MDKIIETQVLIIGGGATGTGVARDLALRGLKVILAEKNDLNAGASGANHGLLHSGARYVFSDGEAARECREEGELLKLIAPHCIEETGGIFAAVRGDDEDYIADFPGYCAAAGIPCKILDVKDAMAMEPCLSPETIAAYEVPDAAIDPFKLVIENLNHALDLGGTYFDHLRLDSFVFQKNRIDFARLVNTRTGEKVCIKADAYVSAAGAWAGYVADLAGINIPMVFSKGSLLVTGQRLASRVINRLRRPGDADILVPGGVVSILGTTSVRAASPDGIFPTVDEVDKIIDQGRQMVPELSWRRYIRSYCGVRPLVGADNGDDRSVSRGFSLLDHAIDGKENFVTITGGKLTTYRLMAEKASDMVCEKLGIFAPCRTRNLALPVTGTGEWTRAGFSLEKWAHPGRKKDSMVCECEMVPVSAVESIISGIRKNRGIPDLLAIGLRSRMGKGTCQGSACSTRATALLYDRGDVRNQEGVEGLRHFLNERWKGEQALLWGDALSQSSLKEMIHCGLFCLDREPTGPQGLDWLDTGD